MRWARLGALALAALATVPAAACDLAAQHSGSWTVERGRGVDWLRDPCGERTLALGVDIVDGGASGNNVDRPHYDWRRFAPSLEAWSAATRNRLDHWGFNSVGAWSLPPADLGLPATINLELGRFARFHWFDPFDPATAQRMFSEARRLTAPYRGSPLRLGYFSDNEVGWWSGALFLFFAQKPAANLTKQHWVALLRDLYGDDWGRFTADFVPPAGVASWDGLLVAEAPTRLRPGGDGSRAVRRWTATVAEHYYALAGQAIRAADPGALYFGDRLPIYYDADAVRVEARHVDALAVNYDVDSPEGWIAHYFFDGLRALSGAKPVLVSEWFYAAQENRSGNRNNGHLMTVATQAERARGAAAAAANFAAVPEIIGLDWFQYYDYPSGGRADREDYDFGLVDINDLPYGRLVASFAAANRALPKIHARAHTARQPAAIAVPKAHIDSAHRSLVDWPKPASLLPPLRAAKGEVAFGEAYLAWSDDALALGFIGQDYYDPDLLAYDGAYPLGEAFHVELDADAGAGPRRLTLYLVPPPRGDARAPFTATLCAGAAQAISCAPVAGGRALYFGADQPRTVAAMVVPWSALGVAGPPPTRRLKLEVSARSWYRARWMSLSGLAPEAGSADPAQWREARLKGK